MLEGKELVPKEKREVFQIGTRDPDLESIDLFEKKCILNLELKLNLTQRTHVSNASPIVKLEIGADHVIDLSRTIYSRS